MADLSRRCDMELKKPTPKESEIQKAILEYLNMSGHFCWRNNTGSLPMNYKGKSRLIRFGKKGSSDILGVSRTGKIIAIEVKRPGEEPTTEQLDFLLAITGHGGIGVVATSVDDVIHKGL